MAFRHRFSFGTVLDANFGYQQCRIMPEIVSICFCTLPSELRFRSGCAVHFESELTPISWTECLFRSDLFYCVAQDLILNTRIYYLFLLSDQYMIRRLSPDMSTALVCDKFSRHPSKKFYFHEIRNQLSPPKFTKQ